MCNTILEDLERQVTNKFIIKGRKENNTHTHTRHNVARKVIKGLKPTKLVSIASPISFSYPRQSYDKNPDSISQCLQLNASITPVTLMSHSHQKWWCCCSNLKTHGLIPERPAKIQRLYKSTNADVNSANGQKLELQLRLESLV